MITRLFEEEGQGKRLLALVLAVVLSLTIALMATGCSSSSDDEESDATESEESTETTDADNETYIIGIATWDPDDPEQVMYFNYLQDYIEASFNCDFIMSEALDSTEDEEAFIEAMKEEGAVGIISLYYTDLEETVALCEENEMYYVTMGQAVTDEEFDAVKDSEYFLGVIGPNTEDEYYVGYNMAQSFAEDGCVSYIVSSGGASYGNTMHLYRTVGMLEALEEELGITYDESVEDLAASAEVTEAYSDGTTNVVIIPGYMDSEDTQANLMQAFEDYDFDAFLGSCTIASLYDDLQDAISSASFDIQVGVVDCFSDENYQAFQMKDGNGGALLDYVAGSYGSMIAPAFIAVANAGSGNVDVVKPDGEAFYITQVGWTAEDEDTFSELYGFTQSTYENAFSADDIMSCIYVYNSDANYDDFEELASSTSTEDALAEYASYSEE